MSLSLPKPVNTYAGEDELRPKTNGINGNGAGHEEKKEEEEEDIGRYKPPRASDKLKAGIIYPPREIRSIIDKTAGHIAKSPSPLALEGKIREHQKTDPKFSFLNDADPYHQYYRYMLVKIPEDAEDAAKGIVPAAPAKKEKEEEVSSYEPKSWEFRVDLPGVTAMDLDILRLTALFHARRGRSFLSSLSIREGRNYQFDFLRPTHSLYGYYNRMVESYQKVMHPPEGLISSLAKEVADPETKWKTLEEARNRAEWEKARRRKEDEKAREKDEEAEAFAVIDWQDFVIVETIEFTQNDMELDLPPPRSVDQFKNLSMGERRMAAMVMEEPVPAPQQNQNAAPVEEMDIEEEEEEEEVRLQRIKAEQEQARAREIQRAAMESKGMKIRKDYVPKGIQKGGPVQTAKCPYCDQSIPENELSEHIRIELLDPKWKQQKRDLETRRAQAQQMQQGADIATSLRNLAQARTDLFGDELDEEQKKLREAEALAKKREREKIVWDGHTNSASTAENNFQARFNLDEQIAKMHERKGLAGVPVGNSVGPQAGPGVVPVKTLPMVPGLPAKPVESLPGVISAEPTGPTPTNERAATSASISGPPTSSAPTGTAPSIHPSRLAAMAASTPGASGSNSAAGMVAGQVHAREEEAEKPVVKRPKVEKLQFGQMYSEIDWMSLHPDPITLSIKLPTMPEKPEWKLDGSIISVPDLPVATLFSTLRERIKRVVDTDLPVSRIRLDYGEKIMSNGSTLASVNLDDGDLLVMSIRKK